MSEGAGNRLQGVRCGPGFFPEDRTVATLANGQRVPFEYRCVLCGEWHVYPTPCPDAGRHEEAG